MGSKGILFLGLLLVVTLLLSSRVAAEDPAKFTKTAENSVKTTDTVETSQKTSVDQRFCPCCGYFRRRCVKLCCPDGREIVVAGVQDKTHN